MTREDHAIDNRSIDESISRRAQALSFGELLLEEGATIVVLDDDGEIVEIRPDGTRTPLR